RSSLATRQFPFGTMALGSDSSALPQHARNESGGKTTPPVDVRATSRSAKAPPDSVATLLCRLATRAGPPPLESTLRKSDRWVATRLIAPSASTSTAFQPDGVCRITYASMIGELPGAAMRVVTT